MLLFAFTAALALVACPGPTFIVQQYAGAQRPSEAIGVLRVNGADSVRLLSLDDEDVAAPVVSDGRLHIEILPGRHTVSAVDLKASGVRSPPLAFQAEAGRVYRVAFVPPDHTARVFEVERGSDAVVRDVTLATEEPPRPGSYRLPPIAPSSPDDAGAPSAPSTIPPTIPDGG
jgi:hypothetical protein